MNHVTVGVYLNGSFKINVVADADLADHIEYNRIHRPGRLFFVDGKYMFGGCIYPEPLAAMVAEWEQRIAEMQINTRYVTVPYE